jgi:hypothetical protein
MVFAFYGNFFYLLKEVEDESKGIKQSQISLKQFIELKPQLSDNIIHKLENVTLKLIEKGHTRHTIV